MEDRDVFLLPRQQRVFFGAKDQLRLRVQLLAANGEILMGDERLITTKCQQAELYLVQAEAKLLEGTSKEWKDL